MKQVLYKGLVLSKGSTALELWDNWQSAKTDRNVHQKKLDDHIKEVDKRHKDLMERCK